jgi:hypothetical protein
MTSRKRLLLAATALALVAGTITAGVVTANAAENQPRAAATPGATATFSKAQEWGSGYVANFAIRNAGPSALARWRVEFTLPAGTTVGSFWDATVTQTGQRVVAVNRNYNAPVAPNQTVNFGFVASGTGSPSACTLNGASCGGGPAPSPTASPTSSPRPTPTASPTSSPKPTPTTSPSTPTPTRSRVFAPYIHMTVTGRPSLTQIARDSGAKALSLAFVLNAGSGCDLRWDGSAAIDTYQAEIAAAKAAGVQPIVSTGGANGSEVAVGCRTAAATAAQLEKVLAQGVRYLDFDVEGAAPADATANTARAQAIKQLQQKYPDLKVSFTLASVPTDRHGTPGGVLDKDKGPWTAAVAAGVKVDRINLMTMNFGTYYDEGQGTTIMGRKSIQAAQDLQKQIKQIHGVNDATAWKMVGITPMIGVNDTTTEIFQLANVTEVVDFAKTNGVGMLSFWSISRDKACAGGTAQPSPVCSGVVQQPNQFSRGFAAVQN